VSSIKVGVFICAYAITYSTLFIFEQKYSDPGEVLYIYESIAGYGLVRRKSISRFIMRNFKCISLKQPCFLGFEQNSAFPVKHGGP
jgi:hypothetical protein